MTTTDGRSTTYFWLNFSDPYCPPETALLGAAIVSGNNLSEAAKNAHALGCNPGGQVFGSEFDAGDVPDEFHGRLLDQAEVDRFRAFWAARAKKDRPRQ
jgi:hypothetical protein